MRQEKLEVNQMVNSVKVSDLPMETKRNKGTSKNLLVALTF